MPRTLAIALVAMLLFTVSLAAADTYQTPPPELAQLVDAPLTPIVEVSPDRKILLLLERPSLPPITELAEPELRLAGVRINPANFGPSRDRSYNGMLLVDVSSGRQRAVSGLPDQPRIRNATWSPDSGHVAFTIDTTDEVQIWTLDVRNAEAERLSPRKASDTISGRPFDWLGSSEGLLARLVPDDLKERPEESRVPEGPVIQENIGRTAPARTYQDLLSNPQDERTFEHFATSELAMIDLDGEVRELGHQGIIISTDISPDGHFILVETIRRPYSYLVPWYRFPRTIEILDMTGERVRLLADLPLQEEVPLGFGSVPTGMRSTAWRDDAPATVYWTEALDEGNARKEAEVRDRVIMLEAPFDGDGVHLVTLPLRFAGVTWGDEDQAYVSEWWWSDRTRRLYEVDPSSPGEGKVIFDYSFEDRYNDPGNLVTTTSERGREVVALAPDGDFFLIGEGASPEGDRPFLRRFDREEGTMTELFRSTAPHYELPIAFLDEDRSVLLTRRESNDVPPNYFARTLGKDELRALTQFSHPYPELKGIQKEFITYQREDGVTLSAMLYLPPGYDATEDGPLPGFVWAYPNEYKDASVAGQIQDSPYRFKWVSYWGPVPWVTRGYAVFDDAAMPVVGEGDVEPNDSFREQIVMNAKALIEEGARRGVLDPDRAAVGGHSYGAFMTANLLAHSDLFRAGIARSGAYNRSLTPFGFQAEERTFWEAPEVYFTMSPFMNAEKVNEPILMIHGEADNNSGTFPMQSDRFYNALKGMGKTARLVMLPHESHGYRSRESIMHMLWEMDRWLETYVKKDE